LLTSLYKQALYFLPGGLARCIGSGGGGGDGSSSSGIVNVTAKTK